MDTIDEARWRVEWLTPTPYRNADVMDMVRSYDHLFPRSKVLVIRRKESRLRKFKVDPGPVAAEALKNAKLSCEWRVQWDAGQYIPLRCRRGKKGRAYGREVAVAIACPEGYCVVFHGRRRLDESESMACAMLIGPFDLRIATYNGISTSMAANTLSLFNGTPVGHHEQPLGQILLTWVQSRFIQALESVVSARVEAALDSLPCA